MHRLFERLQAVRTSTGEPVGGLDTFYIAEPHSKCTEHGVKALRVAWAEPSSQPAALF